MEKVYETQEQPYRHYLLQRQSKQQSALSTNNETRDSHLQEQVSPILKPGSRNMHSTTRAVTAGNGNLLSHQVGRQSIESRDKVRSALGQNSCRNSHNQEKVTSIIEMLNDQIKQGKNFYDVGKSRDAKTPQRTSTGLGLIEKSIEVPRLQVGLVGHHKVDLKQPQNEMSPKALMELRRQNFDDIVEKRQRMNHTAVEGFYRKNQKYTENELRGSNGFQMMKNDPLEGKVLYKQMPACTTQGGSRRARVEYKTNSPRLNF